MSLEVKIEIKSTVKKQPNDLADHGTHSFIVYVQGCNGNHIEHFIKQVVFHLPVDAPNPIQVKTKPPYFITGSTVASLHLSIELFLYTSEKLNKRSCSYYVHIPETPLENSVCVKTLRFINAPLDFRERLLLGGAELVDHKRPKVVNIHGKCKEEPIEEGADSQTTPKENNEKLICKTEPDENVNIPEEIGNQLSSTSMQSRDDTEQNCNLIVENVYSFDKLFKENDILKQENEALTKKFTDQEGIIATCAKKLPDLIKNYSAAITELNDTKEKAEANEAEIATLKSAVQILMSEILQHKNKLHNVVEEQKSTEIQAIPDHGKLFQL